MKKNLNTKTNKPIASTATNNIHQIKTHTHTPEAETAFGFNHYVHYVEAPDTSGPPALPKRRGIIKLEGRRAGPLPPR